MTQDALPRPTRKTWLRTLLWLIFSGFVSAMLVSVIAFFLLKPLALGYLRHVAERTLAVDGGTSISWGLEPTLTLKEVSLDNALWGSRENMLEADEVKIRFRWSDLARTLWQGRLNCDEMRLVGARIVMERDLDGTGNWSLLGSRLGPMLRASIDRLVFDDATVDLAATVGATRLAIRELALEWPQETDPALWITLDARHGLRRVAYHGRVRHGEDHLTNRQGFAAPPESILYSFAFEGSSETHDTGADADTPKLEPYGFFQSLSGVEVNGLPLGEALALAAMPLAFETPFRIAGRVALSDADWQVASLRGQLANERVACPSPETQGPCRQQLARLESRLNSGDGFEPVEALAH